MSKTTIPGRAHYTLLAGSIVRVPIFNDDGDEIGREAHVLEENVCIYIEGQDEVKTSVSVRVGT